MMKSAAIITYVGLALVSSGALLTRVLSTQAVAPKPGIAAAVRHVFNAKCAACHGSELSKPEGRFGYVLDLRRIAKNPEMVIPSSPNESELWMLVQKGEMPPPDASDGPLTESEKEIIRTWIEQGAPSDQSSTDK